MITEIVHGIRRQGWAMVQEFRICREIGTDFAGIKKDPQAPVDKLWITSEAVDNLVSFVFVRSFTANSENTG